MSQTPPITPGPEMPTEAPNKDARMFAMLAHLLAIFIGFIGPLIIWLMKKDEMPFVDDQGKEALNFQITVAIALVICVVLSCLVVGMFLLPVVGIANLIFCIIAAIKANDGQRYRYPVTLRLIK